jgi:hypothetical protein
VAVEYTRRHTATAHPAPGEKIETIAGRPWYSSPLEMPLPRIGQRAAVVTPPNLGPESSQECSKCLSLFNVVPSLIELHPPRGWPS